MVLTIVKVIWNQRKQKNQERKEERKKTQNTKEIKIKEKWRIGLRQEERHGFGLV